MDLNADLGEGGICDREMLQAVTSASIACGAHAGDRSTMVGTARAALALGVVVGAHPSYPDRLHFGRRPLAMTGDELAAVIADQVAAMTAAARTSGGRVAYVKPHGALYNQAAVDPAVADPVVTVAGTAGLPLLGPPGSELHRRAREAGVPYFCEAFADRAYAPDGSLLSRDRPGAVIRAVDRVAARAIRLAVDQEVEAADGSVLRVEADSLCLHGDTPGAGGLARAVRQALEKAGVTVAPFLSP